MIVHLIPSTSNKQLESRGILFFFLISMHACPHYFMVFYMKEPLLKNLLKLALITIIHALSSTLHKKCEIELQE